MVMVLGNRYLPILYINPLRRVPIPTAVDEMSIVNNHLFYLTFLPAILYLHNLCDNNPCHIILYMAWYDNIIIVISRHIWKIKLLLYYIIVIRHHHRRRLYVLCFQNAWQTIIISNYYVYIMVQPKRGQFCSVSS